MTRAFEVLVRLRIGESLRAGRESLELSQHDVAVAVGTSCATISRREAGELPMSVDAFMLHCETVQLNPEAVLTDATAFARRN